MAEIVLEVVHRLLLYFTMKKGEKSYVEKVRSAMMIDANGCALVIVSIAVLVLAFPVQAATTEVHVLEYALNGATMPIPITLWGPYITGTMQDSTTINWKTENATTGTVKYATEGYYKEHGDYDHTITDTESKQLHHLDITNLTPNTVYHYHLILGHEYSGDHNFKTYGDDSFTFIVYGDSRAQSPLFTQMERHKLVADRIASEKDVSFTLHTGDFVCSGNDQEEWNRFFESGRAMLANTTIYPVLGNHDDNHTNYYETFGVPEWYSFDCGNAHFSVLDSNDGVSQHMTEQTEWLRNDIACDATWKFVSFHHPIYSSDERHGGGWKNAVWEDIFIDNSVNAAFNGHVHAYERYEEKGIQYVVVGCGGAPLYPLAEAKIPGYQNSFEHTLGYVKITIEGANATMNVIQVADVSEDNKEVTHIYPQNTVFETVVLSSCPATLTKRYADWIPGIRLGWS